jgi:hypothetical protein
MRKGVRLRTACAILSHDVLREFEAQAAGSGMTADKTGPDDNSAQILRFERRKSATGWRGPILSGTHAEPPPVEDVGKYAGQGEDDYRHRMKANAAAFVVLVLLIVCGYWLADTIAQMRKNQDCALSGRRNCTPVQVTPSQP